MKMRKILEAFLFSMCFLAIMGCSSGIKLEQPDTLGRFSVTQTGMGNSIGVAQIFNYSSDENLNQHIAQSVMISELSLAGFDVLERGDFKYIVDEHLFADNVAMRKLASNFSGSDYIAVLTLSKVNFYTDSDIYIIYNSFMKVCDIRVDLKIINTRTGKITSSFGEGKATMEEQNFVLILGKNNSNIMGLYEDSYRLAVRQAISRLRMD